MIDNNIFFDANGVRLAVLLGTIVSLLIYQRYGVTMGAFLVPGYLAIYFNRPLYILTTLILSLLTYWIVSRWIRPRLVLWGRQLLEIELLTGLGLQLLFLPFLFIANAQLELSDLLLGIGFTLPVFIAHDMGRQGVGRTLIAVIGGAALVWGALLLIAQLGSVSAVGTPAGFDSLLIPAGRRLAFPPSYLLLAILVSLLVNLALYRGAFFGLKELRTGGIITPAYLALFLFQPADLLFVAFCAVVTYLFVTRLLKKRAILFGRSKMVAMVLCGFVIAWASEIITLAAFNYAPWQPFNAIGLLIVAFLANDAERQGVGRTLTGVTTSTVAVLAVCMTIAAAIPRITMLWQFILVDGMQLLSNSW